MNHSRKIAKELHRLDIAVARRLHQVYDEKMLEDVTCTNIRIIRFLAEHPDCDVYQRDLEKEFGITRSTASRVLMLMEQKGMVERRSVEKDARLKKLMLTEKAIAMHEDVMREITDIENKMQEGIPEEDLAVFFRTLDKIKQNLGTGECCCPCRTEDERLQGGKRPL